MMKYGRQQSLKTEVEAAAAAAATILCISNILHAIMFDIILTYCINHCH